MGKATFDEATAENPKMIAAGATPSWLWFASVLYCRRTLTDGFIPKDVVPKLVIGLSQPFKHAARLVEVGLWHDAVGGYQVHDFHDWNPSKAQVQSYRSKERKRKQEAHGFRAENGDSARNGHEESDTSARSGAPRACAKSESGSESGSERSGSSGEESAREGATRTDADGRVIGESGAWSRNGAGRRRTSPLLGQHHRCDPATFDACNRGLCVPAKVAIEWRQQYGDDTVKAERDITAFVARTVAGLPPGPVGDDPFAFWRKAWAAAHASRAPQPPAPQDRRVADVESLAAVKRRTVQS